MSEQVIRHRGPMRDEDGKLIAATDVPLTAKRVAPGGGTRSVQRARSSENVACTVYFKPMTDLTDSDELTVRDQRYSIIVNDWRASSARGGLEVLCTRGQG